MNGNNIKENQVKKAGKQKSPEMEDLSKLKQRIILRFE